MATSESHLIIQDSLERRYHHEATSCYLAKHRDTIYKNIPINHLIPLAFHVKVSHLKTTDLQLLITLVCKKYDNSNLFSDWQKYCKAIDPEKRVIATLEGAVYFAAEGLPPSEGRESWMSSCLNGFHLLKHGNDVVSGQERCYRGSEEGSSDVVKGHPVMRPEVLPRSLDNPLALGTVSQEIEPIPAQQEENGNLLHDHPVLLPSKHASTESPGLSVSASMNNVLGKGPLLDDAARPQMMTTEHQPQGVVVPFKRKHTAESSSKGDLYGDVKQENIKLIKRSNEIDYKGSSTPIDNLPSFFRRLPIAMDSSNQWRWERRLFKDNAMHLREDGVDRTDCLNFFVPKDPSHDISVTLMVGHAEGLALIDEMEVEIIRV